MVISPSKAGSLGSNPSQSQDSASSRHLSLRTNTSPRKDTGKGKATETVNAEQLKDSSGEIPSPHTIISHQPVSTTTTFSKKVEGQHPRSKHPTKPPHGGESSPPQHQENHDSQEGMMAHSARVFDVDNLCFAFSVQDLILGSDNDDSSLENRLKKLETSFSGLQEENARVLKDNNELRIKLVEVQKEISDLKVQAVSDGVNQSPFH